MDSEEFDVEYLEGETQETLLHAARNGDLSMVQELLNARANSQIQFDVSCKGKTKSNFGWTPLHLASYFGHLPVVQLLLEHGAEINAINDAGDTALHKAAFIGREDLVLLLLQNNADVNIINGEGKVPREMAQCGKQGQGNRDSSGGRVAELLLGAERTEARRKEERLLGAARDGDLPTLNQLLRDPSAPNINCVDSVGNSCLHCAAYRGHKEAAVLLLQNGIDPSIKNNMGQMAVDLSRDSQMQAVLCVRPIRQLQRTANRFEGQLLKRSRFLGWKPVWAVLERGVLSYFLSHLDASSGTRRRDCKYLDNARATTMQTENGGFSVHFSDGTIHRLSVALTNNADVSVTRQKWLTAISEHAAFSGHYLWGPAGIGSKAKSETERISPEGEGPEALRPLGSMQDALQAASANHKVLEQQLQECAAIVEALQKSIVSSDCLPTAALMRFHHVSETASNMLSSLNHCLTLFHQQEEVRVMQLKQEQEKCRVLEEALNVLAKEHHELEQSVATHISKSESKGDRGIKRPSPRFYDTSDDEFYDAFEADSDSDTLVTAHSPLDSPSRTLIKLPGPRRSPDSPNSDSDTLVSISSCATLRSTGGHAYRCARDNLPLPIVKKKHR